MGILMSETAIIGRNVEVVQTGGPGMGESAFSWSAAFAGALAATAVAFLLISLGAGIGFLASSPYSSGPSATTLTVGGAIWILLSQTWGYAVGGYLAGRLRARWTLGSSHESNFRDGAHGFVAWALGVLMTASMVALGSAFAIGLTGHVASTIAGGAAAGSGASQSGSPTSSADPTGYYSDTLFRSRSTPAQPGQSGGATAEDRAEAGRILARSLRDGRLSDEERAYLGRVVAARTGMPPEEANRRVDETDRRMREEAKAAADKAAKAASYTSFWAFMALLMGAAAAVVGALVGGNQRDESLLEA
jgi:hypothetical protein